MIARKYDKNGFYIRDITWKLDPRVEQKRKTNPAIPQRYVPIKNSIIADLPILTEFERARINQAKTGFIAVPKTTFTLTKTKAALISQLDSELKVVFPDGKIIIENDHFKIINVEAFLTNVNQVAIIIANHNYNNAVSSQKLIEINNICKSILNETDWMIIRHDRENFLIGEGEAITTSLNAEQYKDFQLFRNNISKLSDVYANNPLGVVYPAPPSFLNSKLNIFEPYTNLI